MPTGVYDHTNKKGNFQKGHIAWAKGRTFTEEHRENLSKSHLGKKHTEERISKIRNANKGKPKPFGFGMKGERNPNWRGGTSTERRLLMGRKEYILWRTAVFIRDDYTCVMCNERGAKLEADHIKPWSLYPELRYSIDNGRTLCKECHMKTDTWGLKLVRGKAKIDNAKKALG